MHDVVAAAAALVPAIRAAADEIEAHGRLPDAIANAMAHAGLFTLLTPAAYGGAEVDPPTAMRAVEWIGRADGSAGWLALNGSYEAALLGWLSAEAIAEMRADDAELRVVGATQALGRAYATDGGYRVSGRWDFVSGISHANWVLGGVVILDGPGGAPRTRPDGSTLTRIAFAPRAAGTVTENWDVMGMRGTGSHDWLLDDEFVPAARTMSPGESAAFAGPRYQSPYYQTWGWSLHGANALGIARGALDDLAVLSAESASRLSDVLLRERPPIQSAVGEAEAIVRAARAFLFAAVGAAWDAACAGEATAPRRDWEARLALTHAVHEAVRAVALLYDAVGTNAIFRRNRLERAYRDLQVAKHHIAASRRHYETVGAFLLGDRED